MANEHQKGEGTWTLSSCKLPGCGDGRHHTLYSTPQNPRLHTLHGRPTTWGNMTKPSPAADVGTESGIRSDNPQHQQNVLGVYTCSHIPLLEHHIWICVHSFAFLTFPFGSWEKKLHWNNDGQAEGEDKHSCPFVVAVLCLPIWLCTNESNLLLWPFRFVPLLS